MDIQAELLMWTELLEAQFEETRKRFGIRTTTITIEQEHERDYRPCFSIKINSRTPKTVMKCYEMLMEFTVWLTQFFDVEMTKKWWNDIRIYRLNPRKY